MRLIIVSFKDVDISDGLTKLLNMPGKHFDEIISTRLSDDLTTVLEKVAEEFDLPVTVTPTTDLHTLVHTDDVLAFVWDNTEAIHKQYLSVEDFGLECWDISEGLAAIETAPEEDDLEEELVGAFMNFMDVMTDYITENVLAMIEHQISHLEEDDDN